MPLETQKPQGQEEQLYTPPGPQPIVFEDFSGGLNTNSTRPGIKENELWWSDGFFPIAPNYLRTIPDVGPPLYDPNSGGGGGGGGGNSSQLWVVGSSCELMQWPLAATGNIAPTINIQGSLTTLTGPNGDDFSFTYAVDFDSAGNQYAFNFWAEDAGVKTYFVPIFAKGTTGNVAPARSITRSEIVSYIGAVELTTAGLCLDSSGNIYVGVKTTIFKISNDGSTISTFVNNDTGLENITSLRFDAARNWVWASSYAPAVKAYDLTGTVQRSLTWGTLFSPWQVTIDSDGQIYVADSRSNTGYIYIFAASANGTDAPTRTIENDDASTSGAFVIGVAVDTSGVTYMSYNSVADSAGHVVSYAANASGVASPVTNISGNLTYLDVMISTAATEPQQLNVR